MSMNVRVLNGLRSSLGLNTFTFRPHAGTHIIHHVYIYIYGLYAVYRYVSNLSYINILPNHGIGESGDIHHLTSAYMLSHGINHGVNLQKKISLWYLYYLDRIGISGE